MRGPLRWKRSAWRPWHLPRGAPGLAASATSRSLAPLLPACPRFPHLVAPALWVHAYLERHTQRRGLPRTAWGWPAGACPRGPCGPDAPAALPSPQSSKVLAKRELLYVPLIGWTWYFLEIVFCKRKWEEDREAVIKGLRRLADYPEYVWVSEG